MSPKSTGSGWKTGEQFQFLVSHWAGFKHAQAAKTLDHFWSRVFELWYQRWPIGAPPLASRQKHGSLEAAWLMLQKEKNGQIKSWFNNRCRGADAAKVGRGDLKLDLNSRRKLAPVQAYCSYAWDSGLRQIVLTRWEQQKATITFDDEDDPPEDAEDSSVEACIPLSFKLKIAKELYDALPAEQKKDIDTRREDDRKKLYRNPPNIEDDKERIAKLQDHQRNQSLVPKSLLRILKNLEDQSGCIAQLIIASVDPKDGSSNIQKFCQGRTEQGLTFETFYGDEWVENVEQKFGEWALLVFGEQDSKRRKSYILPQNSVSCQEPTSGASPSSSTQSGSSQNVPTPATSSQTPAPRPKASQKTKFPPEAHQKSNSSPQPPTSEEPVPEPAIPRSLSPTMTSATQVTGVSDLSQHMSTPAPISPASGTTVNPLPSTGELDADNSNNMALLAQARSIHKLFTSEVTQVSMPISQSFRVFEPTRLIFDPAQLYIDPSQVTIDPAQSLPESSEVPAEVVVTQPSSSIPPQLTMAATATAPADAMPGVRYRTRESGTVVSEKASRRGSIDGAPEIIMDLRATSTAPPHQDPNDSNMQELVVDLSDYVSLESDDETHVSSSQKSSDECRDLLPSLPPPSSQWRNSSQSQSSPTRTYAQLDVDEGDLPTWMVKKGQWKYIASTAGGPTWEKLLKIYMEQERRLEFTEMGATLPNDDRPSKVKEYFQYAHQPSRGDSLAVPGFGVEVTNWWKRIQPEWRCANKEPPQNPTGWSYILSGGSKGAFLVIMCLAWWDRAYARHREEESARRIRTEVSGVANFDDLPDHDKEWLDIVDDVAFVMEMAKNCEIPTRGLPSPSRRAKRKRDTEPPTPRKKAAARTTPKTRSKA